MAAKTRADYDKKELDRIGEMQTRYEKAQEYTRELYDAARDDKRFVTQPGAQWDDRLRARRGDRPTYEFPKLGPMVRQVVNEMRQARPQGKVRGVEENDVGLAEIMQGLGRNIEDMSNADQAYDIAYENAVKGGMGAWRLKTDYATQDDFNLDIYIEPIRNPFAVKYDPSSVKLNRSDANWCFVEDSMSKEDFEREYPDADITGYFSDKISLSWREDGKVRIAEYWYKKPENRVLWALVPTTPSAPLPNQATQPQSSAQPGQQEQAEGGQQPAAQPASPTPDPQPIIVYRDEVKDREKSGLPVQITDESATPEEIIAANGYRILKSREVKSHKVMMQMTNGYEWLTEPYEFPSQYIPIVLVWGNIEDLDGQDYWQGMVRQAKDQQRLHNVHRVAVMESIAKAPKAPFILKMSWIKGFTKLWEKANAEDRPFLPIAEEADGTPTRVAQAEIPAALMQVGQMDNDDMKAATGIYDASLGLQSNETSGVAIGQRKMQGAVATFNYADNLSYSIRYTWEILIDMIPKVYDTPRVVRIMGQDGGQQWKQLYQQVIDPQTGATVILNDISKGKYDVTVTIGPSYATQRMEAVDSFSQLAAQIGGAFPAIGPLLAYQVVKNLDLPGSEEVSEALRMALVRQGLLQPQEGDPQPPQGPNPMQVAQMQEVLARTQKHLGDAAEAHANAERATAEGQTKVPLAQADIAKTLSETVGNHIENMDQQTKLALAHHLLSSLGAYGGGDAPNSAGALPFGSGVEGGILLPTKRAPDELSKLNPGRFNGSF